MRELTVALAPFVRRLDAAERAGRTIAFWWRDDDATDVTARLDQLVALARAAGASPAIAAIPEGASPRLGSFCAEHGLPLWQHGVAHENHQPCGKPAELGDARPVDAVVAACVEARARLAGPAFAPVMVPPWNRMRHDLAAALAAAGYAGVSVWGEPPAAGPLARLDTHVDPVDWRGGRGLLEDGALEPMAAAAFAQDGPIGLLTHHLSHTEAVAAFVAAFAAMVRDHPAARWVEPNRAIGIGA